MATPLDPEVPARMAQAIEHEYLGNRKLFVRVLPNAFAESQRALTMRSAFSRFRPEPLDEGNTYRTIVLDLSPSLEELRKAFDPKWRNKLCGAEKNDLRIVMGSDNSEYRIFCRMYDHMRKRKTFETTVDIEEFGRIQETLAQSERMQTMICEADGVPTAGLVISAMGDSAIYLLGATGDNGLKSKGAYLLHWTAIQWLQRIGIRWYDLGGIDPEGNPGVYSFKRGFSGADLTQISPMVASDSAISSGLVKAGLMMQRTLRSSKSPLNLARSLKQRAIRN